MNNTLTVIQHLFRLGRTLSKIVFICAVIGFCGCAAGLISAALGSSSVMKLGGLTLHGILSFSDGRSLAVVSAALSAWLIFCGGEAVLAWSARRYFVNELFAGTPFTFSGADELKHLGILTICIPLGCAMLGDIVQAVIAGHQNVSADFSADLLFDNSGFVALGVMFLVMSLLCRHGAEQTKKAED